MRNNSNIAVIRTSEGYESINIMDYEESYLETLDIVKIGNSQLKPYLYIREFNLDWLNRYELEKYGLEPKIYKCIGVSTEYNFKKMTSDWVAETIEHDNRIGDLLKRLECVVNDSKQYPNSIIEYVFRKSKILNYFETIEQAEEYRKSFISITQLDKDRSNLDVVCLNINYKY